MSTSTRLIPVVDLMCGQVVRGVRGDRQAYRPIVSALCGSSEPVAVASRLVAHCASRALYVADLDAITGGAAQAGVLRALLQALPGIELWLDAGFADSAAAAALLGLLGSAGSRVVPVYGSESLLSQEALARCSADGRSAVLSLDRRGDVRLDPAGCWDVPALWPRRVIVMTLDRVGSGDGPDLGMLQSVRARKPDAELIGAGGVRSSDDLAAAAAAGAAAWLVASALHDLRIPAVVV